MSFNKATKVFSFLTTSGIAIGVTIGMIIFNGNKELLKKEEEQVLDNFDLELKKFENEELSEQEQSDDDKDQEGESGADDKKADEGKSLEEDKDKEAPKEKGAEGAKGPDENVIEVPENEGVSVALGAESTSKERGDLLMQSIPAGKEKLEMQPGEERKVILGDGGSQQKPKQDQEKGNTTHAKGEHASGEECENCPKGDKEKSTVEVDVDEDQVPAEKTLPEQKNLEEKAKATLPEEPEAQDLEPKEPPQDQEDTAFDSADGDVAQMDEEVAEAVSPPSTPKSQFESAEITEDLAGQEVSNSVSEPSVPESQPELEEREESGPESSKDGSLEMQDSQQSEAMAGKQETDERGSGNYGASEESTDEAGSAIANQLGTLVELFGELDQAISNLKPKVS